MRGMVIAGDVDTVSPRSEDQGFDPLDDAWQRGGAPYLSAQRIVEGQQERAEKLRTQPNQLYRRLGEAVAFAADLAGWAAWVDLPEAQ